MVCERAAQACGVLSLPALLTLDDPPAGVSPGLRSHPLRGPVPPRPNRIEPWGLKKALYRRRNEIERLFRRLKGFRRIFGRFDKLDLVFIFIYFALIVEALRG